jgi:hypothetical protein
MNDDTPPPPPSLTPVRPPDFVLPRADGPVRHRPGQLQVYLIWGGEIYGPATADDVQAGLRSSSLEEDALFWFEGQNEWAPVATFPRVIASLGARLPTARHSGTPQQERLGAPAPKSERTRPRQQPEHPRPPKAPRSHGHQGYWLVAGFILLAIGLTVGVLLLIWRFI